MVRQDQNATVGAALAGPGGGLQPSSQTAPVPFSSTLADQLIPATNNSDDAIVTNVSDHYRLSFLDVSCLIINRMIGKDASR